MYALKDLQMWCKAAANEHHAVKGNLTSAIWGADD